MNKILSKIWSKISQKNITDRYDSAEFSETREMETLGVRDIKIIKTNQKPAEAGIGESRSGTYKPDLDSNYSISDTKLKSNGAVDNFSFPGPEGNRTPETRLSRSGSFQTGPRVTLLYHE